MGRGRSQERAPGADQRDGVRAPGIRKDAAENRIRLLDAARKVFADQGMNAPLEAVATEAGVGIATLYRRFQTREDLLAVLVEEELSDYVAALESALAESDAWSGFSRFLERMCEMQVQRPGLCHAPFLELPNATKVDELRDRMEQLTAKLIDQAKDQGALRHDVTEHDIFLLATANSGIIANTAAGGQAALSRHLALMLEAFRAR